MGRLAASSAGPVCPNITPCVWGPAGAPANSGGSRDKLVEPFSWSIPSEGLAGPSVEQMSDLVQLWLGVDRQISPLAEELAHEPVPVRVGSALPGRVRVAEIDRHPSAHFERSMG